jgi:hypothetical protein
MGANPSRGGARYPRPGPCQRAAPQLSPGFPGPLSSRRGAKISELTPHHDSSAAPFTASHRTTAQKSIGNGVSAGCRWNILLVARRLLTSPSPDWRRGLRRPTRARHRSVPSKDRPRAVSRLRHLSSDGSLQLSFLACIPSLSCRTQSLDGSTRRTSRTVELALVGQSGLHVARPRLSGGAPRRFVGTARQAARSPSRAR